MNPVKEGGHTRDRDTEIPAIFQRNTAIPAKNKTSYRYRHIFQLRCNNFFLVSTEKLANCSSSKANSYIYEIKLTLHLMQQVIQRKTAVALTFLVFKH